MDGESVLKFIHQVFGVVSNLQGTLQEVLTVRHTQAQAQAQGTQRLQQSGKKLTSEALHQLQNVVENFKQWGRVGHSGLARLGDVSTAFDELLNLQQGPLSLIESYLTAHKERTSLAYLINSETLMGMEPQEVAQGGPGRSDYSSDHELRRKSNSQRELHKHLAEAQLVKEGLVQENKRLKQDNQKLAQDKESLERRNVELESQIALVEGQRSRETDANGVYSTWEADPTTLGTILQSIKSCVARFTRTLMDDMTPAARTKFAHARHKDMAFTARKSDIKYVFQQWATDFVLEGLWGSNSFSYRCLPVGAKTEQSQKLYFSAYKQLKSIEPSSVPDLLIIPGCAHEQCTDGGKCWWVEFSNFCNQKWEKLKQTEVVARLCSEAALGTAQLKEDLVALLTHVWLAYLLTLAFEQPATIFKVSDGAKFVAANMEPTMLDDEETNTGELRVAFMVVPGFRVGKSVIKSLVYISPSAATGEPHDEQESSLAAFPSSSYSAPLDASAEPEPGGGDLSLLPPEKPQSSGPSHLTVKVYRVNPLTKVATVLTLQRSGGEYETRFPSFEWKQDRFSTKRAVIACLRNIGALDYSWEAANATGIHEATSSAEQGTWAILISHNGKTLKNNHYKWSEVQQSSIPPKLVNAAS